MEHLIRTGGGLVSVIVYGDQEKPTLLTYPNLALNPKKMIELQKERDLDQKDEAIAEEIFTEVLGHKSGYVRGMGMSMIPPPPPIS
ncbi:Pollen-specific protein SF21 [Morella rubra]|uniref:Pollen-specific protein SF21 n=1 Tax=Morella rubra TaxID=262757 RepID=A0A6A1WTT1_9ROSI|nr:Pollen-specific protein SF21 [Morella rubra]